jgi:hypothetical protein
MGSREYRPDLGIFPSAEPARSAGLGYGYASANPMSALDPTGNTDEDWISVLHEISTGAAIAAGTIRLACTLAVVCIEANAVTAPLALVAGVISMATSDHTRNCISGKGGCGGAVLHGALFAAGGAFGLGTIGRLAGKTAGTAERAAVNGETAATRLGRDMHMAWDYGAGLEKEFRLPSGKRVDAIHFDTPDRRAEAEQSPVYPTG